MRSSHESSVRRREEARMLDNRRGQTSIPVHSEPSEYGRLACQREEEIPSWIENYSLWLVRYYRETKQGLLSCTGFRKSAGWKRKHWLCCYDLVGIDLLFKHSIPCCWIYLYASMLEKTGIGWYRALPCFFPCNRQDLAIRYKIDEPTIQSYCFHIIPCCSCLALMQEAHEVAERELGQMCCGCHGHIRRVSTAHPKVPVMRRSSEAYKFTQTRELVSAKGREREQS